MTRFFDSEMVRESLLEMEELQQEIFSEMFQLPFFNNNEKKKHLEKMKSFLEKQKLFIFRLSLSDDPEAVDMKEKILESARIFGLKEGQGIDVFFDMMQSSINDLEKTLDD